MAGRREFLTGISAIAAMATGFTALADIEEIVKRGPSNHPGSDLLSAGELELVGAISEGIIPATDTPGAVEAGVPEFIGLLFSDWFFEAEQAEFRKSLAEIDASAMTRYGTGFVRCSSEEQETLLDEMDEKVWNARQAGERSLPPFNRIKALVIYGYYTSETGQNVELKVRMDADQDGDGPVVMSLPFIM